MGYELTTDQIVELSAQRVKIIRKLGEGGNSLIYLVQSTADDAADTVLVLKEQLPKSLRDSNCVFRMEGEVSVKHNS